MSVSFTYMSQTRTCSLLGARIRAQMSIASYGPFITNADSARLIMWTLFYGDIVIILFCRSPCSGFAIPTKLEHRPRPGKHASSARRESPVLPGDEVFYGWLSPRYLTSRDQVGSTYAHAPGFFLVRSNKNNNVMRGRAWKRLAWNAARLLRDMIGVAPQAVAQLYRRHSHTRSNDLF